MISTSKVMERNVEMIRLEKYRAVRGRVLQEVRRELMRGVRAGLLVRIPKTRVAPEFFAHPDFVDPDFVDAAREEQDRIAVEVAEALRRIMA